VSYGQSRNGYIPEVYERTNDAGVPWLGVITSFVIGCVCFLPFPSWQSLVGLITSASVLMYAGAPLSFGALRRRMPYAERPFKLAGGEVLSPLAFIVANLIILWTGWNTDWKLGIAILIGYAILVLNRVFHLNSRRPEFHWRSASWLPVYLVGLGVIVRLSTFGGTGTLPLWWDMLVVAIFSLIIYYWAREVALPTERIEQMINEVVVAEETPAAAS
jgi:amino acid transporter